MPSSDAFGCDVDGCDDVDGWGDVDNWDNVDNWPQLERSMLAIREPIDCKKLMGLLRRL